jgi:hypothetical protein
MRIVCLLRNCARLGGLIVFVPAIRVAREHADVAMVHSRGFQTFNCRLSFGGSYYKDAIL